MGLRNAYQAMIKAFPGGWSGMAGALEMSKASLENRVYEVKGQTVQTETALAMQLLSGTTHFAQAVAELSGGTFVPMPPMDADLTNDELLQKFQEMYEAVGTFTALHRESIEDGVIDSNERADLMRSGNEVTSQVQQLLALSFRIYCRDEKQGAAAMRKVRDLAGRD